MGIVEQYLLQLKSEKHRWRRAAAILTVLSLFVATGVSWNLRMTGITIANGATCGREEHQHTQACPMRKVLICGYEEISTELPTEPPTVPPTEVPTEPPTVPPTEAPTVPPTEAPTEAPTVPATEAPTVPPTEAPTEPPPEPPTEPPAQPPAETQEETVLDAVWNLAADVFSGFVVTAHAEEHPGEERTDEVVPGHVHTDECYEITWLCGLEEHIHTISCYADATVDVESAVIWEADLPELTEDWADDLVKIAQSQLGRGESERNYMVAGDGETRNGITRYGQWYGNPYGDWSGMFMMFCLHYAEVPPEALPQSPGVFNMMRLMKEAEVLRLPDGELGQNGDILFLDTDENGNADTLAAVTAHKEEKLTLICGDWENTVAELTVADTDPGILGYVSLRQLQESWKAREEAASTEPTQPEEIPDGPAIVLDVEFPDEKILRLVAGISNLEEATYIWQWQTCGDGNGPWTDLEGAAGLVWELELTEESFNSYYRLLGRKAAVVITDAATDEQADLTAVPEDGDTITSEPIAPFSIGKNNNVYTIDVYSLPVDSAGNRITGLSVSGPQSLRVNSTTKTQIQSLFDTGLGVYRSAYFGTEAAVEVDDIASVWRSESGWLIKTYYLAYQKTDGTSVTQWKNSADNSISLYMRYTPQFTVTFASEGFASLTETVLYHGTPERTEPQGWSREGYKLLGWIVSGNEQQVYTFEELVKLPVTQDVVYTAKWAHEVTVSFDLGAHANELHPIEPMDVPYGSPISPLPAPTWKNNAVAMAFDGWYLNKELTEPVTDAYEFREDTILYAKWSPKEDGYYVYFMDFEREGQVPLVLVTSSVTEGHTVAPYTPGNAPAGTQWDGKWYLDRDCTKPYHFPTPVSEMTQYLTGANGRDLYLYPGTQDVCRAIFVTYGTKVDPITVPAGESIDLDLYRPERTGYVFAGWKLQDGTPVSGMYVLNEDTTFYARWDPDYVPFEAILRIENANDTGMTQADIMGTWYAKAGSRIRVKSTYTGNGNNRKGTHEVVCEIDGVEYPVYKDAALKQKATLSDVYATYFLYNNTGTKWTDEVNWDDVYTGGEVPYSTRPISSAGDTIINFDYMRVRNDIVFTIPNTNRTNNSGVAGGYIDIYKLQQRGLITGSVTYTGTKPTTTGQNVSASGISAQNISWTYTAAEKAGSGNNTYTLHNMKYGQRIFEVYPVGGSWLTPRNANFPYHEYKRGEDDAGKTQNFSSRRQDLTADFFRGSGRGVYPCTLTAEFSQHEYIALMYAVECLADETPDFEHNGVKYKVNTELCEVVKHTGYFAIKSLEGCLPGVNSNGTDSSGNNKYYSANTNTNSGNAIAMKDAKFGGASVYTLFAETYWPYYAKFYGVENVNTFAKAYIFYYDRLHMNIQFDFAYDSNGDGTNETLKYEDVVYGEKIAQYQFAMPDYEHHDLLEREGYEFVGWMDSNGFVLEAEDWESIVAAGDSENNTMIFVAKWEKISNNIIEYYEDRSAPEPFESHYFDDGDLVQYPTMTAYPEGWVWQESGEGQFQRFDWDVPMYGEYGVQEVRRINGEDRVVNVIRVYGTWDESHTKVIYDPNAPQGGIPGTAPKDPNEYTIWQSEVPVAARGETANVDPDMVFVGWKLDRNGIVYQPGDHVPVQWPRTMTFTAQWAKPEEVVYLRYDPNGGTPEDIYPNDTGFPYKKNATAAVWDNTGTDGAAWFQRPGYIFTGWNTEPDGSGTAYPPDSSIVLTAPVTTLYAQWRKTSYTLSVYKVDADTKAPLDSAEFKLYRKEGSLYVSVRSLTTGMDGRVTFLDLETDTLYKLVEEKPPDGYATISKEIFFALRPSGNTVSLKFYDSAGNEIPAPNGVNGRYLAGDRLLTLTVKNLRGYELPATGGAGIFIYILCGMLLMAAPLVYGLSLRRKYERRLQN